MKWDLSARLSLPATLEARSKAGITGPTGVALAALALLFACAPWAPVAHAEEVVTRTVIQPVPFFVASVPGPNSVLLGVEGGTCNPPAIDHIEVRWKPRAEGKFRAAITVYERYVITLHLNPPPGVI